MKLRQFFVRRRAAANARVREIPMADLYGQPLTANPLPHRFGPQVQRAIARLSERDQETLRQWADERMRPSEMAVEAGLKGGRQSIAYRLKGALARLKVELEKEGITDESFEREDP